jgi:subtilisin-like proprotein convertase family protein
VEISTSNTFSPIVQTISGLNMPSVTLTTPLTANTVYFWRVKGVNSCGTGTPSAGNRFKTGISSCYTSIDVPKDIPTTGPQTVTSTIIVPAANGVTITDLNVIGLAGIHSYVHDLVFTLIGPDNTTVVLLDTLCDGYADFNLNLDDQAASTTIACPPSTGATERPKNPLSAFNGKSSAGTWTLKIDDLFDADGGSLTGWGLNFNSGSINCTTIPTPISTTYTFTGNGNWNVAANWSNNTIPPSTLPAGGSIVINHSAGGQCVLNVSQTISTGAGITVLTGKNLVVNGALTIK